MAIHTLFSFMTNKQIKNSCADFFYVLKFFRFFARPCTTTGNTAVFCLRTGEKKKWMNWKGWGWKKNRGRCVSVDKLWSNWAELCELTTESSEVRVDPLHSVNCLQVKVLQCKPQSNKGVAKQLYCTGWRRQVSLKSWPPYRRGSSTR
jgi:hypothetical protein